MKWKNKIIIKMLIFLICFLISGCQREVPSVLEVRDTTYYSLAEAMIIVATERNRYAALYTNEIWGVKLADGDTTFETYLLGQIQTFLRDIRVMNLLAQQQEIEVAEIEEEQLRRLAETYYNGLSDADKSYIKCDRADVYHMYREYLLANKVVSQLTKDVDLEVSDNEAKVIEIRQIVLDNQESAAAVWELLKGENADFKATAQSHSIDNQIERQLGRGEEGEVYEAAAFSLAAGEISEIIEQDGKYYILQCVSDYEQDATQKRKEEIYIAKKNVVFRKLYEQFVEDNPVEFKETIWQDISCQTGMQTTTTNFFELYKEEFGG